MIRASFGLYNTKDEVDWLADVLTHIVRGEYRGHYLQDKASGEFKPQGWTPDFGKYFVL